MAKDITVSENVTWTLPDGTERAFQTGMPYLGVDNDTANEMLAQGLAITIKPKKRGK